MPSDYFRRLRHAFAAALLFTPMSLMPIDFHATDADTDI